MGFGLNIAQPATSGLSEALSQSFSSPFNTVVESGNFNFGEIIKPYIQGSPENGGYDVTVPSRLAVTPSSSLADKNSTLFPSDKAAMYKTPLIVGGVLIVAFLAFKFLRR